MFVTSGAPKLLNTSKLTVTTDAQTVDPKGKYCTLYVNSGTLYIRGGDFGSATSDDFVLAASSSISFSGTVSIVAAATADVRVLYYDLET